MQSLLRIAICATALNASSVIAGESLTEISAGAQEITRAGEQMSIAGPAEYFTGRVRIDPVWPTDEHINASGGLVTFEPGVHSA